MKWAAFEPSEDAFLLFHIYDWKVHLSITLFQLYTMLHNISSRFSSAIPLKSSAMQTCVGEGAGLGGLRAGTQGGGAAGFFRPRSRAGTGLSERQVRRPGRSTSGRRARHRTGEGACGTCRRPGAHQPNIGRERRAGYEEALEVQGRPVLEEWIVEGVFGNQQLNRYLRPPFLCVAQPVRSLGERATELLLGQMQRRRDGGERGPEQVVLATHAADDRTSAASSASD